MTDLTKAEIIVIERMIRELRKTNWMLRKAVSGFSRDYSSKMETQFGIAASCLEELLRYGSWQFEGDQVTPPIPRFWPPVPGDVWKDSSGVIWLTQDSTYGWLLIPSDSRVEFEWVSPAGNNQGSVPWLLARKPFLLVGADNRHRDQEKDQ